LYANAIAANAPFARKGAALGAVYYRLTVAARGRHAPVFRALVAIVAIDVVTHHTQSCAAFIVFGALVVVIAGRGVGAELATRFTVAGIVGA